MEPRGSLPWSQDPATAPYPEAVASSLHLPTLIFLIFTLIVSFHLHLGLLSEHPNNVW